MQPLPWSTKHVLKAPKYIVPPLVYRLTDRA